MNITLSWKFKYKQRFAIVCSFIVNKLCATDSRISPALMNKVDIIYISVPWFRFTLMDLAFTELFHRFQATLTGLRLSYLSQLELIIINKCNQIQLFPRLTS